jgi:predicted permease
LIAVANVTSLLLARGAARQREWAVRTAMGAGARDILRSAAVESLLITGTGAVLGLVLAWVGVRAIAGLVPSGLPQLATLRVEPAVLATGLAVGIVVGLLAGIAPAWKARRADPQQALRAGDRAGASRDHHRFLRGLIVVEVALSLVLLLGAGLIFRGFESLISRDPGFETAGLLTLTVHLSPDRYRDVSTADGFLAPAVERIETVPGVEAAGSVHLIPYTGWGWNFNIRYEDQEVDDPTRLPLVETRYASPGIFDALGMRLLRGRLFEPADAAEDAPVVVVANEALARRDFPDNDPVGKRFFINDSTFATIVGIVADIRNAGPSQPPQPEVYWNVHQTGGRTSYPS